MAIINSSWHIPNRPRIVSISFHLLGVSWLESLSLNIAFWIWFQPGFVAIIWSRCYQPSKTTLQEAAQVDSGIVAFSCWIPVWISSVWPDYRLSDPSIARLIRVWISSVRFKDSSFFSAAHTCSQACVLIDQLTVSEPGLLVSSFVARHIGELGRRSLLRYSGNYLVFFDLKSNHTGYLESIDLVCGDNWAILPLLAGSQDPIGAFEVRCRHTGIFRPTGLH